jgi:hypothetical protein
MNNERYPTKSVFLRRLGRAGRISQSGELRLFLNEKNEKSMG